MVRPPSRSSLSKADTAKAADKLLMYLDGVGAADDEDSIDVDTAEPAGPEPQEADREDDATPSADYGDPSTTDTPEETQSVPVSLSSVEGEEPPKKLKKLTLKAPKRPEDGSSSWKSINEPTSTTDEQQTEHQPLQPTESPQDTRPEYPAAPTVYWSRLERLLLQVLRQDFRYNDQQRLQIFQRIIGFTRPVSAMNGQWTSRRGNALYRGMEIWALTDSGEAARWKYVKAVHDAARELGMEDMPTNGLIYRETLYDNQNTAQTSAPAEPSTSKVADTVNGGPAADAPEAVASQRDRPDPKPLRQLKPALKPRTPDNQQSPNDAKSLVRFAIDQITTPVDPLQQYPRSPVRNWSNRERLFLHILIERFQYTQQQRRHIIAESLHYARSREEFEREYNGREETNEDWSRMEEWANTVDGQAEYRNLLNEISDVVTRLGLPYAPFPQAQTLARNRPTQTGPPMRAQPPRLFKPSPLGMYASQAYGPPVPQPAQRAPSMLPPRAPLQPRLSRAELLQDSGKVCPVTGKPLFCGADRFEKVLGIDPDDPYYSTKHPSMMLRPEDQLDWEKIRQWNRDFVRRYDPKLRARWFPDIDLQTDLALQLQRELEAEARQHGQPPHNNTLTPEPQPQSPSVSDDEEVQSNDTESDPEDALLELAKYNSLQNGQSEVQEGGNQPVQIARKELLKKLNEMSSDDPLRQLETGDGEVPHAAVAEDLERFQSARIPGCATSADNGVSTQHPEKQKNHRTSRPPRLEPKESASSESEDTPIASRLRSQPSGARVEELRERKRKADELEPDEPEDPKDKSPQPKKRKPSSK